MRFKYLYLTLALLLGLLIGGGTTGFFVQQHYENEVITCKNIIQDAQEKMDAICGGYDLGSVRITEIVCPPGDKELCFCGKPEDLQMNSF